MRARGWVIVLVLVLSACGRDSVEIQTTGPLVSMDRDEICVGGATPDGAEAGCFPLTSDSEVSPNLQEGDLITVYSKPGDPGPVIRVELVSD